VDGHHFAGVYSRFLGWFGFDSVFSAVPNKIPAELMRCIKTEFPERRQKQNNFRRGFTGITQMNKNFTNVDFTHQQNTTSCGIAQLFPILVGIRLHLDSLLGQNRTYKMLHDIKTRWFG